MDGMRNIRLDLMYDGSGFGGWQRQNNARTVQGELEHALSVITGEPVSVIGVSRTDAGVHAVGYVANFQTACDKPFFQFRYGINAILPDSIRVKEMTYVPADFHARYDAKAKTYHYLLDNSAYGNVFLEGRAWHFRYDLDIPRMQAACQAFLGPHDFSAFMSSGSDTKGSLVREIYDCSLTQTGTLLTLSVTGNGFLYNMVRIMMGTLVCIGNGRIGADDLPAIIDSRDRKRAGITAPAHGLYLYHVQY